MAPYETFSPNVKTQMLSFFDKHLTKVQLQTAITNKDQHNLINNENYHQIC